MLKFKYIFPAYLSLLLVSSCTSCRKNNNEVIVPDVVPSATNTGGGGGKTIEVEEPIPLVKKVMVENLSLEVPLTSRVVTDMSKDVLASIMIDEPEKLITVLAREEFTLSLDDYLIFTLRGVKASKSEVLSTSTQVINGQNAKLIESYKDNIRVYTLILLKDKIGYTLSCGTALITTDSAKATCLEILNSFKIN